jgi:ABC-type glycerol-3-phosphate transport system permease component
MLATALLALPFFWMAATSLKPAHEAAALPPRFLPSEPAWTNYAEAWRAAPFHRFYANSVITAVAATALQLGLAVTAAYALVFIRVPGRRAFFIAAVATMLIPDEIRLVPNFLLLAQVNALDSYFALIAPPAASGFAVFVLYQSMRTIPRDLIEAAVTDGAGHFRTLWHVVLPLCRPAVAALLVIAFLGRWNDYLWPLVVTERLEMRTLPIGLAYLQDVERGSARWHVLMAGAVFVTLPVLALYAAAQRWFTSLAVQSGLKG